MKDSIWRRDAIDALRKEVEWEYDWKDEQWYYIDADNAIEAIERLHSAESERQLTCKNCIHLGHAYMMPCKNCKRNQMLPDWYEERWEE